MLKWVWSHGSFCIYLQWLYFMSIVLFVSFVSFWQREREKTKSLHAGAKIFSHFPMKRDSCQKYLVRWRWHGNIWQRIKKTQSCNIDVSFKWATHFWMSLFPFFFVEIPMKYFNAKLTQFTHCSSSRVLFIKQTYGFEYQIEDEILFYSMYFMQTNRTSQLSSRAIILLWAMNQFHNWLSSYIDVHSFGKNPITAQFICCVILHFDSLQLAGCLFRKGNILSIS